MESRKEVSEVCRREGLGPTKHYTWKCLLLSSAEAVFGGNMQLSNNQHRDAAMEAKVSRLKRVLAEITAENLKHKKCYKAVECRHF